MLVKFLSKADKEHLLALATLISLADNPLLWDGKPKSEIDSNTNLDNLSIQEEGRESALIVELKSEGFKESDGITLYDFMMLAKQKADLKSSEVKDKLIKKLKKYPLQTVDDDVNRLNAAKEVLTKLLKGKKFDIPSVPKLMLFELISLALCDGSISEIEMTLLKDFQSHHQLEDFVFDEILERAETVNIEVNKTIAIILE